MFTSAKGILLILFLYLSLAWVGALYWWGPDFVKHGLFFTLIGLATLLALVLASWIFSIWKVARAKSAARPKPAPAARPEVTASPDETALKNLLKEAAARLKASPSFAGKESDDLLLLASLPVYLVVGLEGCGKTSAVLNSGLALELLAGQTRLDKSSATPTNLANIWLAGDVLLIEIGGRYFGGDNRKWEELLRVLTAKPKVSFWRRLKEGEPIGLQVRGVIHCCDLKFFISKPGPEQIERQSQLIQDRLRSAVKIFGRNFRVYTLFTKADQIPYFRDFFARFPVTECEQVLGTTLTPAEGGADPSTFAAAETKRLSRSNQALYRSLAERRLSLLFHESVFARKARIYEFPREFTRIRENVVSFLVQIFRPSPLEPTAINRGFYFSGTREVEALPAAPEGFIDTQISTRTQIPSLDATTILDSSTSAKVSPTDAELNVTRVRRGGLQTQWIFLRELFQSIILQDRSVESSTALPRTNFGQRAPMPLAAALTVLVVFAVLLTYSWIQNRSLTLRLEAAARNFRTSSQEDLPSLEELSRLEEMRNVVAELTTHRRDGAPFSMRLGLYSGAALHDAARIKYFLYLQTKLLTPIDSRLARFLQSLPAHTDPAAPRQEVVADRLKTYVMVSSTNNCQIDSKVVGRELITGLQEIGIRERDPRFSSASAQLEFYSRELVFDSPVVLPLEESARDHAVSYLRSVNAADRYYRDALHELERRGAEPPALSSLVSDYARVLSGPRQVSAAFTAESWDRLRTMLDSGKAVPAPDPCIAKLIGDGTPTESLDEQGRLQIEDLYARDYFSAWRSYLAKFSVVPYTNAQDAAQKLQMLSEFRSPLLGLFKFVGLYTYFPRQATGEQEGGITGTIRKFLGAGSATKKVEAPPPDVQFTLGDVFKAFQPVHTVVPPQSEKWNDQKAVVAYTEALAKLGSAMQNIARNPTDPQAHAEAQRDQDQVLESVRQLTSSFNPESIGGVDDIVTRLLREPALATKPYIISRPGDLTKGKFEQDVQGLCREIRPILSRYPFNVGGTDLTLQEFAQWFAPAGLLWKAQEASLAPFVVREGNRWKQKPGTPDVRISSELLDFLNNAQQVTSTFFPNGDATPGMTYTLRPYFESNSEQVIQLNLDGHAVDFSRTHLVREDFDWPAPSESARQAVGRSGSRSASNQLFTSPFSSQTGPWAVFRMFVDAEPRAPGQSRVEWKKARGATGRLEAIEPPVRLDILSFPGGMDVFNPVFFQSVRCPSRATQ